MTLLGPNTQNERIINLNQSLLLPFTQLLKILPKIIKLKTLNQNSWNI